MLTPIHDSRIALGVFGWLYAGGLAFIVLGATLYAVYERLTRKLY